MLLNLQKEDGQAQSMQPGNEKSHQTLRRLASDPCRSGGGLHRWDITSPNHQAAGKVITGGGFPRLSHTNPSTNSCQGGFYEGFLYRIGFYDDFVRPCQTRNCAGSVQKSAELNLQGRAKFLSMSEWCAIHGANSSWNPSMAMLSANPDRTNPPTFPGVKHRSPRPVAWGTDAFACHLPTAPPCSPLGGGGGMYS